MPGDSLAVDGSSGRDSAPRAAAHQGERWLPHCGHGPNRAEGFEEVVFGTRTDEIGCSPNVRHVSTETPERRSAALPGGIPPASIQRLHGGGLAAAVPASQLGSSGSMIDHRPVLLVGQRALLAQAVQPGDLSRDGSSGPPLRPATRQRLSMPEDSTGTTLRPGGSSASAAGEGTYPDAIRASMHVAEGTPGIGPRGRNARGPTAGSGRRSPAPRSVRRARRPCRCTPRRPRPARRCAGRGGHGRQRRPATRP